MKVVHYNNIDFNIDSSGRITRKSTWHIMPDRNVLSDWPTFVDAVKAWAGELGDDWRLPVNNSQAYTADSNYVVTAIDFKARARYMYEVSFTGQLKYLEAKMLGQPDFSINENGEKEKTAKWMIHADKLDEFLPDSGEVIAWAGELYLCGKVDCRDAGGKRYEVTIRARDMKVMMVGLPTFRRNASMESVKTAKWRVAASSMSEFLAANDINANASAWAGNGYYISSFHAEPTGKCGYYVNLEAKHIEVRLITVKRSVRFLRYNPDGSVANEVIYTGRWQVHRDRIGEFNQKSGSSAAEWADEGFIVTAIEPVKLSEMEYQVTLTAKSPDCQQQYVKIYDDRSKLSSRKDVQVGFAEFKLSPEQCGWTRQDSVWTKLNELQEQSWNANSDCPLKTSQELDWALTQTPLSTMTVAVTEYRRGPVSQYIKMLADWDSSDVLSSYNLCGYSGSWRKINQNASLILDSKGDFWTKITRHYQKAPGEFNWNSTFTGFDKSP